MTICLQIHHYNTDLINAVEYHFKNSVQYPKRSSYQCSIQWTTQGLTEPFLLISLVVIVLLKYNFLRCVQ